MPTRDGAEQHPSLPAPHVLCQLWRGCRSRRMWPPMNGRTDNHEMGLRSPQVPLPLVEAATSGGGLCATLEGPAVKVPDPRETTPACRSEAGCADHPGYF